MRRSECLDLQWSDIKWDRNEIVINARARTSTKKHRRVCPIEISDVPTGLTRRLNDALLAVTPGTVHVCHEIGRHNVSKLAAAIADRAGFNYDKPLHTLRKNRAN